MLHVSLRRVQVRRNLLGAKRLGGLQLHPVSDRRKLSGPREPALRTAELLDAPLQRLARAHGCLRARRDLHRVHSVLPRRVLCGRARKKLFGALQRRIRGGGLVSVYNEYSIPDAPVVPLLSSAWLCLTPHCARCSSKCSPNYFKFFGVCHGAELRWLRHEVESRAQPQQCTRIRSLDNCSVRCARVVVCALAFEVKHGTGRALLTALRRRCAA